MVRPIKTKADHAKLRAIMAENTIALALTPAAGALTGGTRNAAYSATTFASANAVGSVGFRVSAGALPVGLSLNAGTGALTGIPTVTGANSFTITATDQFGNEKANAYTLAIANP